LTFPLAEKTEMRCGFQHYATCSFNRMRIAHKL